MTYFSFPSASHICLANRRVFRWHEYRDVPNEEGIYLSLFISDRVLFRLATGFFSPSALPTWLGESTAAISNIGERGKSGNSDKVVPAKQGSFSIRWNRYAREHRGQDPCLQIQYPSPLSRSFWHNRLITTTNPQGKSLIASSARARA